MAKISIWEIYHITNEITIGGGDLNGQSNTNEPIQADGFGIASLPHGDLNYCENAGLENGAGDIDGIPSDILAAWMPASAKIRDRQFTMRGSSVRAAI